MAKKKSNSRIKFGSRSRGNKLALWAVVLLVAVVGVKLLINSLAASSPFTLLGTHPQASQQSTALGKTLLTLQAWNGKIYAGYGDYGANTGPIAITPFDPATNTFAATPEETDQTEAIYLFRNINGKLYASSADPRGGVSTDYTDGSVTSGTETWQQVGPANSPLTGVGFTHAFDTATLTGSDLWVVGSKNGNGVAYRSLDGGVTWQEMLSVPPTGPSQEMRFYMAAVYNGKLYLQGRDWDNGLLSKSNVFDGTSWSNGPQFPGGGRHPDVFAGKLVYLSGLDGYVSSSTMYAFNGSTFKSVGPTSFYEYTIDGSYLYALGYNNNVYRTSDLSTWTLVQLAPSTARSIAVYNNNVYVGTTDSQIWGYNLANGLAGSSSTSGTTTKTCHGKKC